MSFKERSKLAKNVETGLDKILTETGIEITDISYENIFKESLRNKMRKEYNSNNIIHVRFQPDRFAYIDNKRNFFLEYKICNTPINYDSRVEYLRKVSGDETLNKSNIGAIEATALLNYTKISSKLGLDVAIIVYCTYHEPKFVAEWVSNIKIKNEDNVIIGEGNASRTPYVNVNLDEFRGVEDFFKQEFNWDVLLNGIKNKNKL